jgi:hypothetical protein
VGEYPIGGWRRRNVARFLSRSFGARAAVGLRDRTKRISGGSSGDSESRCASRQPAGSITLDKTHIAAFDGSTHSVVIPGGGLLGAAVGETLSEDHSAMLGEYQLEDPVAAIRTAILARLVRRFGLSVVSEAEASGEVGAPVATDLSLAIDTESWGIIRTRASHYGVKYRGSLRLTDNRTHQVIAEGACASRPVDSDDTPTIDELRANEGALLKTLLAATAEYCIDDYRKRVLGLY